MKPWTKRLWGPVLGVVILGGCAYLAVTAVRQASVTFDEVAYLPMGISVWREHVYDTSSGTTPLPSMLAALPVLALDQAQWTERPAEDDSIWSSGRRFATDNAQNYQKIYETARAMTVVVLLATGLMAYFFARGLYGPGAGLITLVVVCFSPEMLAHGGLVTTDAYLAAAVLASLWALDALIQRPGWWRAGLLGLSVGTAMLCKFSGVLLWLQLPVAVIWMWDMRDHRPDDVAEVPICLRQLLGWGTVAVLISLAVVHVGYGFDRSFCWLDDFTFQSGGFKLLQDNLPGRTPVPMPYVYLAGLDAQLSQQGYQAYLLGQFSDKGFWNYYLVGFLVKTPEPILALILIALFTRRRLMLREVPLVMVALTSLAIFSFAGHKNIGVRYLLFLIPLAAVWCGRLAKLAIWTHPRYRPAAAVGLAATLLALVGISVAQGPYYLAYFNAASGGPLAGHKYLLDSNIDWGQDLVTLDEYMKREHIDSVDLAYFGWVDPAIYGIKYQDLVDAPTQRYAVISTNLLWGERFYGYYLNGRNVVPKSHDFYAAFRDRTPKAVLGYNLYVYDMQAP